jgi:KRAB domain-containing zinc finger protein
MKCDGCTVMFSCQDELDCHRSRGCLQDSESIKCPECGKEFETKPKLKRHLKTHDPKKRLFVCDQCGHGSMSESQMKLHKFMHVTDRPFKCHLCPSTFKLDQHLKGHQKVHKIKPFECYLCAKKFRTYDKIRLHMG